MTAWAAGISARAWLLLCSASTTPGSLCDTGWTSVTKNSVSGDSWLIFQQGAQAAG